MIVKPIVVFCLFYFFSIQLALGLPIYHKRGVGSVWNNSIGRPLSQFGRQIKSTFTRKPDLIGKADRYAKSLEKSVHLNEKMGSVSSPSKHGIFSNHFSSAARKARNADKQLRKSSQQLETSLDKSSKSLHNKMQKQIAVMDTYSISPHHTRPF